MELRHLRYFLAVAEVEHLTRAADRVHVTQSTLSHQIRELENELGTPLFHRVGRNLRLSQAGEIFREFAKRSIKETEAGKEALSELEDIARGTLRIGVIHTFNSTLIPPVVVAFTEAHPRVQVIIEELTADLIERGVTEGQLDVGIAFHPASHEAVVTDKLFDEELVLIVGPKHVLAKRRSIQAGELARYPLALLSSRFGTRRLIDQTFVGLATLQVKLEMNSIESLLNTARLGSLGTILSERTVPAGGDLAKIRLRNPTPVRHAAIVWHRERYRSAAAREFARVFVQAYAMPARPGGKH